ncbi:hypothetical protein CEXT_238451 [Caerostris extrusa]|uniref:Uncharacterized protein n=1 Tax=Caerostris extrusa TaxID=172846 RepID=A0AAV4T1L2_CAEEX|nr:hypothetical protein CEXT_238451 [Caerostris extrusa]
MVSEGRFRGLQVLHLQIDCQTLWQTVLHHKECPLLPQELQKRKLRSKLTDRWSRTEAPTKPLISKTIPRDSEIYDPVNGNENNLLSQSRGGIRNRDYFRLFWVSCSNDLMVRKSEKLGIKFTQKHLELSGRIISLESV